jgi:hypothetical protein
MSVTGARASTTGYVYRLVVRLRESAGVAATIAAVDLTFMAGTTEVASSHHDQPISATANVCPANGTVDTRELMTIDADASHPFATTVRATVSFTDATSLVGTATGTADVPPLSGPPPPQTFALTGLITDDSTPRRGIAGARLEVLNGLNAGTIALTDDTGIYVMSGLFADTFRLRASVKDYRWGEQNVTVPANPRADFTLSRSCWYTLSPSSATVSARFGSGTFTATASTPTDCSSTALTSDKWITLDGPTSGSSPGVVNYSFPSNRSAEMRVGTITADWSGGSANFTLTQLGASCTASRTIDVAPDGWSGFFNSVDIGETCYFATEIAIDVPWIRVRGTSGGGRYLTVNVDSNSGAPRTGHVTLSGTGLYLQLTFAQAGTTSSTAWR